MVSLASRRSVGYTSARGLPPCPHRTPSDFDVAFRIQGSRGLHLTYIKYALARLTSPEITQSRYRDPAGQGDNSATLPRFVLSFTTPTFPVTVTAQVKRSPQLSSP